MYGGYAYEHCYLQVSNMQYKLGMLPEGASLVEVRVEIETSGLKPLVYIVTRFRGKCGMICSQKMLLPNGVIYSNKSGQRMRE